MTSNRRGPCAPCTSIFSISAVRLEPPNDRCEPSGGRVFVTTGSEQLRIIIADHRRARTRAPYDHLGILENLNEMFRAKCSAPGTASFEYPGVERRPATRLILGKLEWRTQAGATP